MVQKLQSRDALQCMVRNAIHSVSPKEVDGHMRSSNCIHDMAGQGRNPLWNPKDAPEVETYLIRVGYTLATLCRTTGMNKVMIASIQP
jgi:hypothetical protein